MDAEPGSAMAVRLAETHDQAKQVLAELRELIHGVHPQVLTDCGLPAAVDEIAGRSSVTVEVDIVLPGRLSTVVETTAYFVVSEALTNMARHSGSTRAREDGRVGADRLIVEIRDDGVGGANTEDGTGLKGLADRVAAAGGTLILSSPSSPNAAVAKHVGSIFTKLDLPVAETDHRRELAVLAYLRGA